MAHHAPDSGGEFGNQIAGNNRGRNAIFSIDGIPMIDGWSGNAIGPAFTFLDSYREMRTFRPNVKIGGPVWLGPLYNGRNKTFFHFAWQTLRGSQAPQVSNFVVPTMAFRTGDFSSIGTPIIDPLTNTPFAGNMIPANRISPVSKYFQDTYYPQPNSGCGSRWFRRTS